MTKFSPLWMNRTSSSTCLGKNAANPLFGVASFTTELAKGRLGLNSTPADYGARRVLAELLRRHGALGEATTEAQTALWLAEQNHDRRFVAWCWWTLSSIDAQRGDWTGAQAAATRCAGTAREQSMQDLVIWATPVAPRYNASAAVTEKRRRSTVAY
ncbi:MAG: hypothetical protein Q8K89_08170 [Actinomycetota bacterium]|nr:hypothetical protein [Actinomycetota bacterium]